ncbi:MAG: sigma-70 family RNA polymerase sigma factor [Bacteroidota bacterium]
MSDYTDIELLEKFRNADTSDYAFNLIVQKYQKQIYWNVRRMVLNHQDADDITQNVFIKVWRNLHQFRQDAQLSTWIFRIGVNETLTFIKRQKLKSLVRFTDYEEQLSNSLKDDSFYTSNQTEHLLQMALLKLPPRQRLVFNMRYYDELPYEQMSAILGTSVGALKASYHIASKKIENFISSN